MSRGILYCTTTIVPGLVKIGISKSKKNFMDRMWNLEHDGYRNITGIKRAYAIIVDDYDAIEKKIQEKYKKERVGTTELFALDINEAKSILSALPGEQIYPEPKAETKEEINVEANDNKGILNVPDGIYYLNSKGLKASLKISGDEIIIQKGSNIATKPTPKFLSQVNQKPVREWNNLVDSNIVENGKLTEDYKCSSVSCASSIVTASSSDGWEDWKTKEGKMIKDFNK